MLRFTKQVDYGLMAMQHVAVHQGDHAVGVRQIADEFQIPRELLAKVLQRLARSGLLVSQTGPHGGYRLALVPAEITVGQVIRALEGPVAIVSCMTDHRCPQTSCCSLRKPARKIQTAITDLLDTLTLAELIGEDVPEAVGRTSGKEAEERS